MNIKRIIKYLRDIAANNNREWFNAHRDEYDAVRADFDDAVSKAIVRIAGFDSSVSHLSVKDATYRFYRDTRFSSDKSPYKRHLGAYIAAHGKKAMHGGYYIHIEPSHCLLACGGYWLPTNVLTACRNEIMGNIQEWLRRVDNTEFRTTFGRPGEGTWESPKGFGLELLKTCPSGFPRNYEHLDYLRMKDYCCWHAVVDDFFEGDGWLSKMEEIMRIGKPAMDFINAVVDDYE